MSFTTELTYRRHIDLSYSIRVFHFLFTLLPRIQSIHIEETFSCLQCYSIMSCDSVFLCIFAEKVRTDWTRWGFIEMVCVLSNKSIDWISLFVASTQHWLKCSNLLLDMVEGEYCNRRNRGISRELPWIFQLINQTGYRITNKLDHSRIRKWYFNNTRFFPISQFACQQKKNNSI